MINKNNKNNKKQVTDKELVTYNNYPLHYVGMIPTYDADGKFAEKKKIGKDADRKFCLEQGRYIRSENRFGHIIHWYLCKDEKVYGVAQKDINKIKEVS